MLSLVLYMRTTLYTQLACLEPEPKVAQVSPFIWALAGGGKDGTNLTTTLQQRQRRRRQWLEKRREKGGRGAGRFPWRTGDRSVSQQWGKGEPGFHHVVSGDWVEALGGDYWV